MGIESTSSDWEADDGVACTPATVSRPWDGESRRLSNWRWPVMLESGDVKLLREIVRKEGADGSYVNRVVNLTSLAPDIVEAILDETLQPDVTLFDLAVDPPALWEEQRNRIKGMMPRSRIELNLAADRSGGFRPRVVSWQRLINCRLTP